MEMCGNTTRSGRGRFGSLFSLIALAAISGPVLAYTPTDPVVSTMVDRGIGYLETFEDKDFGGDPSSLSGQAGESVLIAYAHHRCRHDPDSPVVKRGLRVAQQIVTALKTGKGDHGLKRNYEMAVCILLFAEVNARRYKFEMQILQQHLFEGQFPNGAFGYPSDKNGDVSQTQYAMLAIWTLDRNGLVLDFDRVVSTAEWLLRVQDRGGGWPYKGIDPGKGKPRTTQSKVDMSMALAGGSSILIAADVLRLWGDHRNDEDPSVAGLPDAIKIFRADASAERRKRATISQASIVNAVEFMDEWRKKNPYQRSSMIDWYYYQLYTLERFESFVEIANRSPKDASPAWYDQGVEELRHYQSSDGGWTDRSHSRGPVSTAFALLFLIRSTQQTMFPMHVGSLGGGDTIPKDTTNIRVDGTRIMGGPTGLRELLGALEKDGTDESDIRSIPDDLELDDDPITRAVQLDRLERLVRGSKSWQSRRVAARLLGHSDELRVVPALIFALSDPDESVRRFARDGLRFISRKFDGYSMPDHPTTTDVEKAQQQWRTWFRSMNPKHVFLDYDL